MVSTAQAQAEAQADSQSQHEHVGLRSVAILLVAGMNLTLVQYIGMKEFPALVGSNEIAVLTILVAYFLGLSLGYLVSDTLSRMALLTIGIGTLLLHCSMPFLPRYIAGTFARFNLGGNILPGVFFLVLFGIAPFYAVFLPRLVSLAQKAASASLARLYATELAGGLIGLVAVVAFTPARIDWILTVHIAGLVVLLWLFAPDKWRVLAALSLLPVVYMTQCDPWHRASLTYLYKHWRNFDNPQLVASELSPYQRIDIIQDGDQPRARKYLYLNGNLLYGSRSLHQHNLLVSILPNLVLTPASSNALVVGGGSLDAARYLAGRVGRLRIVELDEAVVRLTRQHIQAERGDFPENWELIIDDGKHYLGNYVGAPFTVIAIDIPVPTHLQTAMLHSQRFFELAKSRLTPGGIFSISLANSYEAVDPEKTEDFLDTHLAHRIMAGLLRVFSHVTVVQAARTRFAWASDTPLGLAEPDLNTRLKAFLAETRTGAFFGSPSLTLMAEDVIRERARGFKPIGEADMQIVLRMSVSKLYYRYYEPRRG